VKSDFLNELPGLFIGVIVITCLMFGVFVGYSFAQEPTPVTVTNPVTINPPPVPEAPVSITVSGIEDTSASVSWEPSTGANNYTVWVDGQRWTGSNSTGALIQGLKPYTNYDIYVTASNDNGESGPSSPVTFMTLPPVPAAPQAPVVSDVTNSSAIVSWEPLPAWQYIQVYRVYVDGRAVADVEPQNGIQAAKLTNLEAGKHVVAVSGINENREGPLSKGVEFTITSVAAPAGLVMFNHTDSAIYIKWDSLKEADKYLVYVGENLAGETREANYILTGLEPSQACQVKVVAVMPDGNESAPAVINAETLPAPEPVSKEVLKRVYPYVNDVIPGLVVVFAVGGAFVLARSARQSISSRIFLWRILK